MSRWVKNVIGDARGYGGCDRCDDRWNWKKPHTIWYSDAGGMFPLCEECYQEITPQERYDYCKNLWIEWGSPEHVDFNRIAQEVGLQSSTPTARTGE